MQPIGEDEQLAALAFPLGTVLKGVLNLSPVGVQLGNLCMIVIGDDPGVPQFLLYEFRDACVIFWLIVIPIESLAILIVRRIDVDKGFLGQREAVKELLSIVAGDMNVIAILTDSPKSLG